MPQTQIFTANLWRISTYKYPSQMLSSNLSWYQHIDNICTKAWKLLSLIYCQYPDVHLNTLSQHGIHQSIWSKIGEVNYLIQCVQRLPQTHSSNSQPFICPFAPIFIHLCLILFVLRTCWHLL